MKPVVTVERLSKTYRVYAKPFDRLIEPITRRPRHRPFHALNDVSFNVAAGEALGVIGENGAGKSTLLKIVSGITSPSEGGCTVRGQVAAILELGSGFHPEFSGHQNIVLNAAMLGLDQDQIDARMPSIVAFSELGHFLDQPVKTYSTGMAMRLAFSIAIQVEPDVLIVDEALSVGDGYFQKKCLDALQHYLADGGTLLFCSHAMYYVSAFCQRALWMREGRIESLGPTDEVINAYEAFLSAKAQNATPQPASVPDALPAPARLRGVEIVGGVGQATTDEPVRISSGASLSVDVTWTATTPELPVHVGVALNRTSDGIEVCAFGTHQDGLPPYNQALESESDVHCARRTVPELSLVKGEFTLYVYLIDESGLHVYDQRILPAAFRVESDGYRFGICQMPHQWTASPTASTTPSTAVSRSEPLQGRFTA